MSKARRRIRLTFTATGESATADLLDDEAPTTAQHVWDRLPIEERAVHGQFSGAEVFVLVDDPKTKGAEGRKTPMVRLREALDRGEKVASVTGRVIGWTGHFPPFLKALPAKPRRIMVKDFQIAPK